MAKELYGDNYAKYEPNSIFASGAGARAIAIAVAAGEGSLKRGSILVRDTDNTYKFAATADVVATNNLVILDEDLETGSDNTQMATVSRGWSSGVFMSGKLILKSNGALTAANMAALSNMGIKLKAYEKPNGVPSDTITEATHSSL